MKNLDSRFPVYADCNKVQAVEHIEAAMAEAFADNPMPEDLTDRILWLHDMYAVMRNIEANAQILVELTELLAHLQTQEDDDTLSVE